MTVPGKCSLIVLIALVIVPSAGHLTGQEPKPTKPTVEATTTEMTEDVEVLRRLLNKAVGLEARSTRSQPFFSTAHAAIDPTGNTLVQAIPLQDPTLFSRATPSSDPVPQFDGVHLRGHGIAYTVRLGTLGQAIPAPHEKAAGLEVTCQNCHTVADVAKFNLLSSPQPQPKVQTEWERTRDELRGVPPKSDPNAGKAAVAAMCLPGNLAETVTKVLAANGRHLRHLAADESVSVVVTYDGLTGPAHDRVTGTMADPSLWNSKPSANSPPTTFGLTPDESKQIVLGDLHLKQGKHEEAVKAYEAALARYGMPTVTITALKSAKYADVQAAIQEIQKSVTTTYRSLAQAYIGVGNLDGAKRALELAQGLKVELSGAKTGAATPVPAKILLTVKKGHLDAAEKLSPVEFRKGMTVEMIGLTPMKK